MSDFNLDPAKFGNLSEPQQPTGVGNPEVDPLAQDEERASFGTYFKDIALAVPRGIEGAVQDTYGLLDTLAFDALPDYSKRALGESETMVGGFVEGTANFLSGFAAPYLALGKFGKIGRAVDLTFGKEKALWEAGRKGAAIGVDAARGAAAGAVADFIVFSKQDGNLSDLINEYAPALANPVSEYLASDAEDSELEGRLKNTLDGVVFGSVVDLVMGAVRYTKVRNKVLAQGGSAEDARIAAEKEVPPERILGAYQKTLDPQYPGTFDDVVWNGKDVSQWEPEDFRQFGEAHGVQNFGPLSELKDVGEGIKLPGGTDGTFTFYDMVWMRANPIDTRAMPDDVLAKVYRKLATSVTPDPTNTIAAFNRFVFSMLSPGTKLADNETMTMMARARSKEEVEQLAAYIDWEPGDYVSKERRMAISKKIAEDFKWQSQEKGGLGLRNNVDLTNLAELAKLWTKDPSFFLKHADETWQTFMDRTMSQVRGLGAKTAAFGSVWADPLRASIAAIDRHMAKENFDAIFPTKAARREWERSVVEEARAAGVQAKNLDDVLADRSGSKVFTARLMDLVFADRTIAIDSPNVPEHLKGVKWINRPKFVRTMSDAYRNALAHNDEAAKQLGLSSFVTQWAIWDRRRGLLEPHYSMFPGLEKLPRMSVSQIERALNVEAQAKMGAGNSRGKSRIARKPKGTEDTAGITKFSPDDFSDVDFSGSEFSVTDPFESYLGKYGSRQMGAGNQAYHALQERGPMHHSAFIPELDAVRKFADPATDGGRTFLLNGNLADDVGLVVSIFSKNVPIEQLTPENLRLFAAQFSGAAELPNVRIGVFRSPDGKSASIDFNVVLPPYEADTAAQFSKVNGQRSYWDGVAGKEVVVNDVGLGVATIQDPAQAVKAAYRLAAGEPGDLSAPLNARTIAAAYERTAIALVDGVLDAETPVGRGVLGSLSDEVFGATSDSRAIRRAEAVKAIARDLYQKGDLTAPGNALRETLRRDLNVNSPLVDYVVKQFDQSIMSDVSLSVLERVPHDAGGVYTFIEKMIRMNVKYATQGRADRTFVHELWHHISAYLPDRDLKVISDTFNKERAEAMRADPELARALADMDAGFIPHGVPLNKREYYRFTNIDEWFAEKGVDRTELAFKAIPSDTDGVVRKVVYYLRQQVATLMNALRYRYGSANADVVFDRFIHAKDNALFPLAPLSASMRSVGQRVDDATLSDIPVARSADEALYPSEFGGDTRGKHRAFREFLKGVLSDPTKIDEVLNTVELRLAREAEGEAPAEGLNPRNLDAADLIATELQGNELNLSGYMLEDGPLQFIRSIEVIFGRDMEALVPGLNRPESFESQSARGLVELSAMAGGDVGPEGILAGLHKMGGKVLSDARQLNSRINAFKLGLALSAQEVDRLAGLALDPASDAIVRADFAQRLEFHIELVGVVKGLMAEQGRGLGFNRAPTDVLAIDKANFTKLLEDAKSRGDIDGLARAVRDAMGSGGRNGVAAVSKLLQASPVRRGLDMLFEYWYGAILSGPKTFSVNSLGSIMTSIYLPMERILGGTIRQDSPIMQQSMRELRNLITPTSELLHVASSAAQRGGSVLDPSRSIKDGGVRAPAITAKNAGLEGVPFFGAAVDWIGKAVRTPGTILQYSDEITKQANYRAVARSYFIDEAAKKGYVNPADVQNYVEGQMDKLIYEGQAYSSNSLFKRGMAEARKLNPEASLGEHTAYAREYVHRNWSNEMSALSQIALKTANEATFQTPLPSGSISATMAYVVNRHPMLRFVAPFVTTPVNILGFAGQRLDVLSIGRILLSKAFPSTAPSLGRARSRLLQDIYGPNATPRTQAEAAGRLAAGVTMAATGVYLASTGAITGRGPADPETRKILQQAGWQPYSIRVGNSYVSFQKLDPFATILGVFADIYDFGRFDMEGDPSTATQILSGVGISLANNFTNKSYLTGISNFMEAMSDPERFVPKLMQRYAGSLVPNALNQTNSTISGDEYVREVRSMLDAMMARIPGLSDNLPPQRNMLGEPIVKTQSAGTDTIGQWADIWIPVAYQEVSSDILAREIAVLKYPFHPPRKTRNGLDLTEFKSASGQDAYDAWNEKIGTIKLGGKTLKGRLTELVSTNRYQQMSPVSTDEVTSPRVNEVKKILERYRSAAWTQTLRDFPELQAAYTQTKTMSVQARLGITPKAVN